MDRTNFPTVADVTPLQAAINYAEQGIHVFPLKPNSKLPLTANGFYDATTDIGVINGWWQKTPKANIGIPTGRINGIMALDIDFKDGKNGFESLIHLEELHGFIPETRTHNTPSGGSHLIFLTGKHEISGSAGKLGNGLDIRANGGYIVAPPSVIDDSKYFVENPESLICEVPEWLVKLANEKKTVEKPTESIPNGRRNEHIFKFGMDCKKRSTPLEHAIYLAMDENEKNCTPPLDFDEVNRTVTSAYRYESVHVPIEIEDLNKIHAVVMVGGKCRVINETTCPIFNRPDISLSHPSDFKNKYANRKINDKQMGEYWFHHPNRREFEGIVFSPGKDTPKFYNLWRGFAVVPKHGDCSLYLKHVEEVICSGNKEIYRYVIAWMAHAVQSMDDLIGTSLVLKGKQGAGKGVFVREFGKLFGPHFTHINQSAHLTGKFNAHLKNTIILFADEACWGGDKQAEGPLKALITEPTLMIEAKGQDPFQVKNHVHVLVSSNNDWVVPCGPEERRFLVLEVSEKYYQNREYFDPIYKQMDNGGREALLYYLMNMDISGIDLGRTPKTEALFEMKMQSASSAMKFWYDKLMAGALDSRFDHWNEGVIVAENLQEDFGEFTGKAGVKHRGTDTELGVQLRKLVPPGKEIKDRRILPGSPQRKQVYTFPPLQECRDYFEKLISQKVEWPDEGYILKEGHRY